MTHRSMLTAAMTAFAALALLACGGGETPTGGGQGVSPAVTAAGESAPEAMAESATALEGEPTISVESWEIGEKPDWAALDHEVEISFWHAIAQRHEAALSDIIENFEAQYPIRVQAVYQGGYGELFTALFAAMRTTSRPTMSMQYESWTSQFMERDLVVPAQAFIDADPDFGDADLADFFPAFIQNNIWNDVVVTLPFNKSLYLLFVNLDMLEAAGLAVPETWEELSEAAITLNDPENRIAGFGVRPFMETFTPLFFMNGGEFITDGQLNLQSPETIETLQFLIGLAHEHEVVMVESSYLTSAFGAGNVALFTGSSAGIPYCDTAVGDQFRWTAAPLPTHEDKPRRVLSQGTNVGIYTGHSPEEMWAAWEFLKFMSNPESSAHYAAISGYLPVRRSSLEVPEYQQYLQENRNVAVASSQLEHATFEPRMPVWESIRETLNRVVGQMFQNPSLDAQAVAQRMVREAMEDLEE